MTKYTDDFFNGKRSWSFIKDKVLEGYMAPYIAKVARIGQRIVLIDGYAGPGIFEDGKIGSPIIMCRAAERYASGRYRAIFLNISQGYHDKLDIAVNQEGYSRSVQTLIGDTNQLLPKIFDTLKQESTLLYLDPFGPSGCNFDLLKPFLNRKQYSTEIILILHMPIMHRLASYQAVKDGRGDEPLIQSYHRTLTKVFGDSLWKDILLRDMDADIKEQLLVTAYCAKLEQYMPYTGFCPVQERTDRRIKYFMVFASRHPDTLILMNDNMLKTYGEGMYEAETSPIKPHLFTWEDMRVTTNMQQELENLIVATVTAHPGQTRKVIWIEILKKHFMRYLEKEYRKQVGHLVERGVLFSPTQRKTKLLNDNCALYVSSGK